MISAGDDDDDDAGGGCDEVGPANFSNNDVKVVVYTYKRVYTWFSWLVGWFVVVQFRFVDNRASIVIVSGSAVGSDRIGSDRVGSARLESGRTSML
jgi:hypothetical protein